MNMRRATTALCAIGIVFMCTPGGAQTQQASQQAELLKDWTALKATMHAIAAEMPAEKYTFRPTEAQQTFGERTVHVASVNVGLLGLLGGTTPRPTIDPKATTKEAALKALDESFDYGVALLKQQTDETLRQLVASPPQFMGPSSRARLITFVASHACDIYGQMVVYLRLNGLVPPASRRM